MNHHDEQGQVVEAPRFLRKHGDPYLYPRTDALAKRKDMFEVADPNATKEPSGVRLDAREAEVLSITTKPGLVAFAAEHGIELPEDANTVKTMQKAIRIALLSRDDDDEPAKPAKPKAAKPKAAKAADEVTEPL